MMLCHQNVESLRLVGLRVAGSEIGRVAPGARRGEDLMAQAAQKITLSSVCWGLEGVPAPSGKM